MKNYFAFQFLVSFFIFLHPGFASDTTITFREVAYSEVFELAQKEQKHVLLYFHFDGCGACRKMERTAFADSQVVQFYDDNFVAYDVNTQKGEGIEINKIYNVRMHPTYLYLDEQGMILHKTVGVFSPEEFVEEAQNALNPEKQLVNLKKRYQNGDRSADFLLDYCYALRDAYELDSLVVNEYLQTQTDEQLQEERNLKFIYEFALHHHNPYMPFGSRGFECLLKNQEAFAAHFDSAQVRSRIVFLTYRAANEAIEKKDKELLDHTTTVLEDFDDGSEYFFKEMDGRPTAIIMRKHLVLSLQMDYYDKAGDTLQYNRKLQQYIDKIWDDSDALNTLAWDFYENQSVPARLEKAKNCVIRSIELDSNYNNNDTYAALLYKLGEYDAALEQAEVAIAIAKAKGVGYKETSGLLELIKAKMKE